MDNAYYEIRFKDVIPNLKMVGSYLIAFIIGKHFNVYSCQKHKKSAGWCYKKYTGDSCGLFISVFRTYFISPFVHCFIVDDQSGPFESVAQSFGLIKGNIIKYFCCLLSSRC
jgi:hypothetical protein